MAAITPTSVVRQNLGSVNLVLAKFTTANDGDTWASGITSYLSKWTDHDADPSTQTSVGVASTINTTTGTVTFFPAENGAAFTFHALVN